MKNLEYTRMYVATGNGIPQPGVEADLTDVISGSLELFLLIQNQEFVDALRKAGVNASRSTRTSATTASRTGART